MFLDAAGNTLYYIRRVDGLETLFAWQPDHPRGEFHAALASSPGRLMAWPFGRCVLVCDGWPRLPDGNLSFSVLDSQRIAALLEKQPRQFHELLTDVPRLTTVTREHAALAPALFDGLRGSVCRVPGFAQMESDLPPVPAMYVIDGQAATAHVQALSFLPPTTIPASLYAQPDGRRFWLTVSDSSHLFVLNENMELVGDVFWPSEQKGLARVAFCASRHEAWVSDQGSVFIYDTVTLKLAGEIVVDDTLRWHRGERVRGFLGGVTFNRAQTRVLLARPLQGDVLEIDAAQRRVLAQHPMTVDPLELAGAPSQGRIYVQGLSSGAISWFPCP